MAVSNSISNTTFRTQRVLDEAYRNCRLTAEQISAEMQEEARNKLYLLLSELANLGQPLWCIDKQILALYQGDPNVPCPSGTVTVLNANLRTLQRLTGTATSSAGGTVANAFDDDLSTSCTQTAPNGSITVEFDTPQSFTTIGLIAGGSSNISFTVESSIDGVSYSPVYAGTLVGGALSGDRRWVWVDPLDQSDSDFSYSDSVNDVSFIRLTATGGTTLDIAEFYIGNTPQEIPLALTNRDDYMSLPNKTFQSNRPTQYWLDLQRDIPYLRIWPTANSTGAFYQITMYRQRYIMDVGTLTQTLDIPQKWYSAIVDALAWRLSKSRKEVDMNLIPMLKADAEASARLAWGGQSDQSGIQFRPQIRRYTR